MGSLGLVSSVFRRLSVAAFAFLLISPQARGVQVITDGSKVVCQEVRLYRELRVYKDPTLFMTSLNALYLDPGLGWESLKREDPVLTTLEGTAFLMRLGAPREFRGFGSIARIYELVDSRFRPGRATASLESGTKGPRPPAMIVPVKLCGNSYNDTLGFVLESDLVRAQVEMEGEHLPMPPSVFPNPIPKLPDHLTRSEVSKN